MTSEQAAERQAAHENLIAELTIALRDARRELHACQAVIHLAGGFDPAYVTGAKAAIRVADAVLARAKEQQ